MTTPKNLYFEAAMKLDPFDPESVDYWAKDAAFRGAVDHAYQAGWRDREELITARITGDAKVAYIPVIPYPPEVYP